jgi:3-oxoacyl-ACP reductase-like protein
MGLLSNLITKIFSHSPAPVASAAPASTAATAPAAASSAPAGAATPATPVDVGAILDDLAKKNPEKLDWKHSIVDLMKLVGMDSSLSARKALASELHYTGDENDSASMNIWLHKQVLQKIADNGGKLPQGLLS